MLQIVESNQLENYMKWFGMSTKYPMGLVPATDLINVEARREVVFCGTYTMRRMKTFKAPKIPSQQKIRIASTAGRVPI
jgi:hypothetical protein